MNSWQYRYDTGWINRSDYTNVHLGSNTTLNTDSNVNHNLNAPLSNLLVKVFISTDGTDATSFEIILSADYGGGANYYGARSFQVDNNNIKVQTGASGLIDLADDGTETGLVLNGYYKVKVWYIG